MINYKKELVKSLGEILPVYYEMYCDSKTETPCITYIENNNASTAEGETLRYSRLSYILKVWGNDIGEISNYALLLDQKMKQLGFRRVSSNELVIGSECQKIMIYEATALEQI